MKQTKKLIEVALPLEDINKASAREKSIRNGHPSTLHLWWARRPLAAARAVIFSQLIDDPSSNPEKFPTEEDQDRERQRLFKLIKEFVIWENTNNKQLFNLLNDEIKKSWKHNCQANKDHPQAKEIFNPVKLPAFHDPFTGGGSIPLEAQRLGLEVYASDLNPVAVLINKGMIEIPAVFSGSPPVNPETGRQGAFGNGNWPGSSGLADDVRYYGEWMRNEAKKRIGETYPNVLITDKMVDERPDLEPYSGQELPVIAWLWSRTVKSPNPAFSHVEVPLASTFMLCTKKNKEVYVEPIIEGDQYDFKVKIGKPKDLVLAKSGTKLGGSGSSFWCLMSKIPIPFSYIRNEGKAGRMGERLMAIVVQGKRGRIYISANKFHEKKAKIEVKDTSISALLPEKALGFRVQEYGMTSWKDLFTDRQLLGLITLSDLVRETIFKIKEDALKSGKTDETPLSKGGTGCHAYAEAIGIYLTFGIGRQTNRLATICIWNRVGEKIEQVFSRQAIPMTWDFAEANIFSDSTGGWSGSLEWIPKALEMLPSKGIAKVLQLDAASQNTSINKIISTDPPYYDNIGYSDLSDFFYIWFRRSLKNIFPQLFGTMAVPKDEELVANPFRHGGRMEAESFFLNGMTHALDRLAKQAHPDFPITIYYAFKQSETSKKGETTRTGWETFLSALIKAGLAITGTWPIRTERDFGVKSGSNVLASSIVIVCRKLSESSSSATRREFINALKLDLPKAIKKLQKGNIAPVDLPQSSIGPGMALFTSFAEVLEDNGTQMTVRTALQLINITLDEFLSEQESQMDAWTRFAVTWFNQFGFEKGSYGSAEELSKAKDIGLNRLQDLGLIKMGGGKVSLIRPSNFSDVPDDSEILTVWESTHRILNALVTVGESGAAKLLSKFGSIGESSIELAYRLYDICEKNKWSEEALGYNSLVTSWPEIRKLAMQEPKGTTVQGGLFE